MPKEYSRPQRVADFLQRELAVLIQQEIRDPRISFVNVTGAEVSRDISWAKVYVTFLDATDDGNLEQMRATRIKILNKAAGFLRSQLARNSSMRMMPRLQFYFDASIERGSNMSQLIEKAVARDKLHQNDSGDAGNNEQGSQ